MNFLHSIGAGIAAIGLFIGSLFGYTPQPTYTPIEPVADDSLGRAVNPVATNNYVIAGSGISSSATSITLTSFTVPVSGVPYTMANFGDGVSAKGYLTIEPGSRTRQEIVSFTGVTQNSDGSATLTGLSRGLLPFSPFTASSSYAVAHNGGSQVTVSNPPQLYDAIYNYVDNATTSGAVDGTTLAKGIYETASGLEAASTTQTGAGNTSATLVLTTLISTSTGGTAYTVPVTSSTGKLDGRFCCSGTTTFTDSVVGVGAAPSTTLYTTLGTTTWTKQTGLRWINVKIVGGGGGGAGADTDDTPGIGQGGGGAGYSEKNFLASDLPATTTIVVGGGGAKGAAAGSPTSGTTGSTTRFHNMYAFGGAGGSTGNVSNYFVTAAGTSTGGTINLPGQPAFRSASVPYSNGGNSILGMGGVAVNDSGGKYIGCSGYGSGGFGGPEASEESSGNNGCQGVVIITEYY